MYKLKQNLHLALSHWQQAVLFGTIWSVFLTTHSYVKLSIHGWQDAHSMLQVSVLFLAGTFLGGTIGWFMSILLGAHRIAAKRFAVAMVIIPIATIGLTAGLFILQYRLYFSQWHMSAFTIGWLYQLAFTSISALYLFAVQGLRTMLPLAPLVSLLAAFVFVKRAPLSNPDISGN